MSRLRLSVWLLLLRSLIICHCTLTGEVDFWKYHCAVKNETILLKCREEETSSAANGRYKYHRANVGGREESYYLDKVNKSTDGNIVQVRLHPGLSTLLLYCTQESLPDRLPVLVAGFHITQVDDFGSMLGPDPEVECPHYQGHSTTLVCKPLLNCGDGYWSWTYAKDVNEALSLRDEVKELNGRPWAELGVPGGLSAVPGRYSCMCRPRGDTQVRVMTFILQTADSQTKPSGLETTLCRYSTVHGNQTVSELPTSEEIPELKRQIQTLELSAREGKGQLRNITVALIVVGFSLVIVIMIMVIVLWFRVGNPCPANAAGTAESASQISRDSPSDSNRQECELLTPEVRPLAENIV